MEKELKPEVNKIIENWYKDKKYKIIHHWEQDDTWFIVVSYTTGESGFGAIEFPPVDKLDFVRIFGSYVLGGEYNISVDRTVIL